MRPLHYLGALSLFFTTLSPCFAVTDSFSTGPGLGVSDQLDDVWQTIFNGWGLNKNADTDFDGCSNLIESIAGTDPRLAGDCHRVGNMVISGGAVVFTFNAEAGKRYRVLSDTTPTGAFATVESLVTPVATTAFVPSANNASQIVSVTKTAGASKFYRLEVTDVDSDGDGVSDWAEIMAGMNALSADTDGDGVSDYDQLTSDLAVPDDVGIAASQPLASEDGPESGTFQVSRSNGIGTCSIAYSLAGTATQGVDYSVNPGFSVAFVAGEKSKVIHVNPNTDASLEGSESVTATLTGASSNDQTPPAVGPEDKATVIIYNSTNATGTGLLGRYYDHSNTTYAHAANFGSLGTYTYTRTGTGSPNTGTIVVPYTYNGSPALQVGHLVKMTFGSGNLANATYNNFNYTVGAVSPGINFTLVITGASLPTNSTGSCNFSIQSFPHPPVLERLDANMDHEWYSGTPNGVAVVDNAGVTTNSPDNHSSIFEGYLAPSTTGNYQFQLDADDKARVLLDLNLNGTFEAGEEIVEHGWSGADVEVVGVFKQSSVIALTAPTLPAQRYKIRVEHVETTGDARCRLQWLTPGTTTYVNIPQANVYAHGTAMTSGTPYAFTRSASPTTAGSILVNLTAHGLVQSAPVTIYFSSGNLFTPSNGNFHGPYTISAITDVDRFTVPITSATTLPVSGNGSGFVFGLPNSPTTGWLNLVYPNTTFSGPPGRIGIDGAGPTNSNNGLWGAGTPDATLINPDTFSVRWTGQIQPQFTEEYAISVHADDGCNLWINGQLQDLKPVPSSNQGGGTYTYDAATGNVLVTYSGMVIEPNSFVVGETVRVDFTSGNLVHGNNSTYSYDSTTGVMTVTYSNLTNITAGSFQNGEFIDLDPTSGNLTNMSTFPYAVTNVTATTFDVQIGAGLYESGSGNINISDTRNAIVTAVTPTSYTFNIGANKYAAASAGNVNIEIVNKTLKDWSSFGNERFVRLPLVGGVRYDIQLEYYENGGFCRCRLYWYSASQPKQIIPASRLYPSSVAQAPVAHTSNTSAVAIVGGSFSHTINGSNSASVSVSGLPAWLTNTNGVLSGTPPSGAEGSYQILITLTGPAGTSTSILNLQVDKTDGGATREYWNGVLGSGVAAIPTATAPNGTGTVSPLQGPTDFGDNYGTRLRGYITAPSTGNYYFWLASNGPSELWISNDDEVVNLFKRASVTTGSATPQTWGAEANQKSSWLALEEGKRYYFEVLYKAGAGAGDNLAVGWSKPGQSMTAPSEVVPGFVLDSYVAPEAGATGGTLYISTMLAQNGAVTNGVGTSTLRLSEDETVAYVRFNYGNLSGELTDWHVHADAYLNHPSAIIYDGVEPPVGDGPQPDGSHKWTLAPAGTFSLAEIKELIKQGKAYINLHTALYPAGEIRGNYTLAAGSRTFTPPPSPPAWTDDHTTNAGAARFLTQATYGASIKDIKELRDMASYDAWIEAQFAKPIGDHLPEVWRTEGASAQGGNFDEPLTFNAWWWRSVSSDDQLRQRIAFALSEILVVSAQGPLDANALSLSYYYDKLLEHSFGNFRDVLEVVTLTPTMGRYLDMLRNDKPDQSLGRIPNENYAREIKQLFSVGLFRMWPDGTLILNSQDSPIDVYTQNEIIGFAHVFTGWDYGYDGPHRTSLGAAANWVRQMREVPARHYTGTKRLLNNEVLPGLLTIGGQILDPNATHTVNQYNDPAYLALPALELDLSHQQLFNHPNVGPFICRQLIQRLVTSNPSRDYLYRVVSKFNDNGSGVRGDMKAVIKAILLDYEARSPVLLTERSYGKQREPLLRVTAPARAFRPDTFSGTYSQSGTRTITVTTTTDHKLPSGTNAYLDFGTGTPAPWDGTYGTTNLANNQFSVQAQNWVNVSYSIPANSTVCTITWANHWLENGHKIFVDFTSGGANGAAGIDQQVYTLTSATVESGTGSTGFTIAVPSSTLARSGNAMVPRFSPGSYTTGPSGQAAPNDRRVTMDTNSDHELVVGDQVQINFYGGIPQPVDMVVTVESVVDSNTWTFLAPSLNTNLSPNQGFNSVYQFPLQSLPLNRSGTVGNRPSTFQLNNTDTDLSQSPLNSLTVFNYYLPDYKFPGSIASQGITTPEFQLTAETNVVRQANFLYNGVFNPSGATNGYSSFISGGNQLVMDFTRWMAAPAVTNDLGAPTNNTVPWTHNQNLTSLIDQFSTLLTAGQLSAEAKTVIKNLVCTPITSIATGANCVVTTSVNHNLTTGDVVVISGVTDGVFTSTVMNNNTTNRTITVTAPNKFSINGVTCTTAPSANGLLNAHSSLVVYNQGTTAPSDTNKRDRLRTIIHLILTSPDFTIQR